MKTITYRDALKEALAEEMERDDAVFLMGEDIAEYGGAYKVTDGLFKDFGEGSHPKYTDLGSCDHRDCTRRSGHWDASCCGVDVH